MLAGMVDHVIGIDPDRDWITAAGTRGVYGRGAGYRPVPS